MTGANLSDAVLITRYTALKHLGESLAQESIVAVDTESNSLFAYQEQVCLIQFSSQEQDFLVDPLALRDLSPLGPLFANPHIEKVFHAAEYDLITLKRDFDFSFENLFDTMAAARILGWEEVGLGAILKSEFGIELDKRHQRANWGRRPLPAEMLSYARFDTHYLVPLRNRLKEELIARGRWELAQEDFRRLQNVNGRTPEDSSTSFLRINGAHDLEAQQLAVLQELCRYRDQVARKINQPVFKVAGDRTLMSIATALPKSMSELQRLEEATPRLVERHGESLLRAVQRGLHAEPVYPPRMPRPDERFLSRLEALREWRKNKGIEIEVPSDVVLPRDLMNAVAAKDPRSLEELAEVLHPTPWRLAEWGEEILGVVMKRARG
jgi:ribonuclease D